MTPGQQIRKAREGSGLSIPAAAQLLGISTRRLAYIEAGEHPLPTEVKVLTQERALEKLRKAACRHGTLLTNICSKCECEKRREHILKAKGAK